MAGSLYVTLNDGETMTINHEEDFLCFACCDCGMVHHWHFHPEGEKLHFMIVQQPRKTGQLRRRKYGNLHRTVRKWWLGRIGDRDSVG